MPSRLRSAPAYAPPAPAPSPGPAFEASVTGMAVIGASGVPTAVNTALCRMLGYTREQLTTRRLADLTASDDVSLPQRRRLVVGEVDRLVSEQRYLHADATVRWARCTTTLMPGSGDQVLVTVEDVTERRAADEAARRQRDRLESLVIAQHSIATAGLDPVQVLSYVTDHALALTAADGSVVELVEGDEMVYRATAGSLAPFRGLRLARSGSLAGLCVEQEQTLVCDDSRTDPRVDAAACERTGARSMAVVPLLAAGEVIGVLKVMSGVPRHFGREDLHVLQLMAGLAATALSQAQSFSQVQRLLAELDGRQEFLEAVLESSQAGIVACDAEGRLTLFNEVTRQWHGVDADARLDASGWADAYDLYEADGVTPLVTERIPLVRALRDGQVTDAEIVVVRAQGGTATRVLCQGRRMRSGDRDLGAVVVMHDVTELRDREAALSRARDEALAGNRAKTAFVAAASHEIRTPLHGVLGTLELLDGPDLDDRQRGWVRVARQSSEALLSLLNDVLDLSKAESTGTVLAHEPFSPDDVARSVVTALGAVAARKELDLRLDAGPLVMLLGDAARLRQVLVNLVGNALKFTHSGSVSVEVAVGPPTGGPDRPLRTLRLSVADTGAGFDVADLPRLLRPFEQGKEGQRHGGTGLGLTLTSQLVQAMGGQLRVESQLGSGSLFVVELALEPDMSEHPAVAAVRPLRPGPAGVVEGRSLRVLVADDGEVNLMVAEALLLAEGAEVTCVTDGAEAVRAVREQDFDLVLLDNHMPKVSGTQAARLVRALPGPARRTRLVALTASAGDEDRCEMLASGMDDVLVKPVTGEDLRRALLAVVPGADTLG